RVLLYTSLLFFFILPRLPPSSTLFPYTTLFRSAVAISGGIAGNVIPDRARVTLNYRFAPDTSIAQAEAHVREVLSGLDLEIEVTDAGAGALPGLDTAPARQFLAALGGEVPVAAKQGWTDVSRSPALGTPAVNFGPGDPLLAHTDDEHVPLPDLHQALEGLRRFLTREGS